MNYYNEFDPHAAAWLRGLIAEGLIPAGEVDERSISDVTSNDLQFYTSCHFFAGIGGWPLAGRLAGLPDSFRWWSGSCPCQPFSLTGLQGGFNDPRDLWPVWFGLIKKCRPDCVFGEQVDGSLNWIDRAAADMEGQDYAFAPISVPALIAGAKHVRQRLFFAAHSAAFDGISYDRMVPSGSWGAPPQSGGLSGLHVAGRWWSEGEGSERLPILVRQFNGLSPILGGFGNAIVPEVGAEIIRAFLEAKGGL